VIVPHFGFTNHVKYLLPAVDASGYSAVRLTALQGGVTVWTAGPEDSFSFTMDCKLQPSNDLNIKLWDELQCCLASKEHNFNVKILVLLLCQCHCNGMCGRLI
jgi:hypothetical protein